MSWLPGTRRRMTGAVAAVLVAGACGSSSPPPAAAKETVSWKSLGAWSGRGNVQTESFVGLTGALRVHWQTKNEAPKGAGTFRLILQSAISGRDLQEPVDEKGAGEGTVYVAEVPHVFHASVESANVDWSFTVEEAWFATRTGNPEQQR